MSGFHEKLPGTKQSVKYFDKKIAKKWKNGNCCNNKFERRTKQKAFYS